MHLLQCFGMGQTDHKERGRAVDEQTPKMEWVNHGLNEFDSIPDHMYKIYGNYGVGVGRWNAHAA